MLWRCMTSSGIPSRDISTAWACRSWWGANRRRTPAASADPMQLGTDAGRRARPPAGRTAQNAEERADRHAPAQLKPAIELLPRPAVHPNLPPTTTLSSTDQNRAALAIKIGLSQRQRLTDPQPGTPEHDDDPAQPHRLGPSPRRSHHRDDLLHGRRIRRIPQALVARHAALMKAGQGCRRPAPPSAIQQSYRFHDALLWTTIEPHHPPATRQPRAYGTRHPRLREVPATRHQYGANRAPPSRRRSARRREGGREAKAIASELRGFRTFPHFQRRLSPCRDGCRARRLALRLVARSDSTRDPAPVNRVGFLPLIGRRMAARKRDFTGRLAVHPGDIVLAWCRCSGDGHSSWAA